MATGRIARTDFHGGIISGEGRRHDARFRWRDCDASLTPTTCGHDTEVEFVLVEGRNGRYPTAIYVSRAKTNERRAPQGYMGR
jgi:hypothetical protein